jgi:capsule polysaccharide export protein KpsE/RkpR
MTEKTKRDSPLVASVLALQNHLDELERIGSKINATDMNAEVDVEYIRKLMSHFAECGQRVSEEVANLSTQLHQAQTSAQRIAEGVSRQAEAFKARSDEQNEQLEKFRILGERVRELNSSLSQFRRSHENGHAEQDRSVLASSIQSLERELVVLIKDLQELRNSARSSRMRQLEKESESLAQTLQAVHEKLQNLT